MGEHAPRQPVWSSGLSPPLLLHLQRADRAAAAAAAAAATSPIHATAPPTPTGVEPELAVEPSAPSTPPPAAAASRTADTAPTASPVTATAPSAPVVAVEPVPTEVASAPDISLLQLAEIFYQQLAHRRLNSIATFHDPALREFFRSEEAFADYYADLVQDLGDEHFEANRPQLIDLESFHVEDAVNRAVAVVNFEGENALPLRFWSVNYSRRDIWERIDDRWWIVPGKL